MRIPLLCTLLTAALCSGGEPKKEVDWLPTLQIAEKLARESGRPILAYVYSSGMVSYQLKDRWTDPRVVARSAAFHCVQAEFNTDTLFANRFDRVIERRDFQLLVIDPWGRAVLGLRLFESGKDVADQLATIPTDLNEIRATREAVERNPQDVSALYQAALFYQKKRLFLGSDEFLIQGLTSDRLKDDAATRRNFEFNLVVNRLGDRDWTNAIGTVQKYWKDFPDGDQQRELLLALVIANVKAGNKSGARKALDELRKKYPDSPSARNAEGILASSSK